MINKYRLATLLLGLFFLFSFYLFSRQVKHGFLKQEDFNFTVVLQNHMPARFDSMWETIALPVTPTPSIFVAGLITLLALVDVKKRRIRFRALLIPLLFGLVILGEMYGKSVVTHPSPPFFMIKHPTTIFPQFYVNAQYSYPSGHTARAVFLGMALFSILAGPFELWKKNWKKTGILAGIILAYIFAVAISRIYLGQHWLSDVIGGGFLGSGLGLLTLALNSHIIPKQ